MKYAVGFFAAAITSGVMAHTQLPEMVGVAVVIFVFFMVLGFWEEFGSAVEASQRERKAEERVQRASGHPAPVFDARGRAVRKRQQVQITATDCPFDSGEVMSFSDRGVVVRFPTASISTFPVKFHRDDKRLHVEGVEIDGLAII